MAKKFPEAPLVRRYTDLDMRSGRLIQRRAKAIFLSFALLFSQLSLAAYVCPAVSAAEHMTRAMAAGAPCEGMDTTAPVLCQQHSADAPQSFELAKLATPTTPLIVQVLPIPTLVDETHSEVLAAHDPAEFRPPPDPLFLQTLRLRV